MRTRLWFVTVLVLALMPASFARADFAQSERWFVTLPDDDRYLLQANLVLLGLYNKFVDGDDALTKFQAAAGESPTGVLSKSLRDELDRQANLVLTRLGLSFSEDQRADVALPVPTILLPYKTDVEGGTLYRNDDQSIELRTIRKTAASVSFVDLYERLRSTSAVREVTYSAFSPQRFVVSGSDRGRKFYLLFQSSPEGSRGFSLTWLPIANSDATVVAVFIASYLMPLELYRTEVTTSTTKPVDVQPETPRPMDAETTYPNLNSASLERMGSVAIVDGAPNVIILAGDITSATPLEFLRALKARPEARVLLLDSDGGLVDPGLVLAHEVHQRQLSTVVPDGADCLSACSFVYFAGKERQVVGNLGVHQVWNEANDLVSGQAKLSDVLEALADFGVNQGVVSAMLRTPPQEMHVFSKKEIAAFGSNFGNTLEGFKSPEPDSGEQPAASVDPATPAGNQSLLLEASDNGTTGAIPFSGTVEWRKGIDEMGLPTLIGEANIPARNLAVDVLIRKNHDTSLPASHLIEVNFRVTDSFSGGSIAGLPGVLLKNEELVQGTPLVGASARIIGNSFLFALSAKPVEFAINGGLLTSRDWMDLALIYSTGKRAILTLERTGDAKALFETVWRQWSMSTTVASSPGDGDLGRALAESILERPMDVGLGN